MTMTMNDPAGRRQALSVAAFMVAVAGLLGVSAWLIQDLAARSDEIAALETRQNQLAGRSPATALGDRGRREARSLFLDGRSVTIAGAALEQRIGEIAAKSGGVVTSSEVEVDGADAKDGFVRLTASIEASQAAMQTILYDIEAGAPYLFIDKLSIQSPTDFGEPETGRYRMTLTVVGQWRPPS